MKRLIRLVLLATSLLLLLLAASLATAQGERQVQELFGSISEDEPTVWFDLFDMKAGETLYAYVESDDFDTFLIVCDILCEETYAEDDDSGGNFNSALTFTFPEDGDYSIAITDCCSFEAEGQFRLLIGFNAPDVLTGEATPVGPDIAVLYVPELSTVGGVDRVEPTDCGADSLQERPVLSGAELTRETTNFIIHYTTEGADGATESYIDQVESVVEEALEIQINQFGWPLPPPDCGEGGDARFDVYVLDVVGQENLLGYASPGGIVVDNPNSPYVETWAAYSYLAIDNDYAGISKEPIALMRTTVAHEFHHAIQFGYDVADALNWYYEATSSWIETVTFVEEEDATPYTPSLFGSADWCVGSTPDNPDYDTRIYGEWLLIDSMVSDYGFEVVERLWEYVADYEGMDVFYNLAAELGTTPQDIVLRMGVRNLLLDYELGSKFFELVRVEANVNGVGTVTPRQDGVQELGVDYLLITAPGVYTFQIDQPNLRVAVVGVDQPSGQASLFDLGNGGTVDTTAFSNAYVLIQNTALHSDPAACTFTNWNLTVSDGAGQATAAPMDEPFDASQFIPAG